ncbi:hypothetical protein AAC387_Pa03g1048 [Persea americana]
MVVLPPTNLGYLEIGLGKESQFAAQIQVVFLLICIERTEAKSQERHLNWHGSELGGNHILSLSYIHDQILVQRRRPGRKEYSSSPQVYKEANYLGTHQRKGRSLLEVSQLLELQKDVREPIRIFLNYDTVGNSHYRDCRSVGDVVKMNVPNHSPQEKNMAVMGPPKERSRADSPIS